MKKKCINNFIDLLQQIQMLPNNRQYCSGAVLILDEITSKIISPLITLDLLFDHGIRSLQKASVTKKKHQDACGIYYISEHSFRSVIKDFENKDSPTYFSINLIFSETASNQTIKQISKHETVVSRVAWFGQLYMNTLYLTENIGTFAPFRHQQPVLKNQKHSQKGKGKEPQSIELQTKTINHTQNSTFMNDVFYSNLTLAARLGKQLLISLISSFGRQIFLDIYYQSSPFCETLVNQLQKEMIGHLKVLQSEANQKRQQKGRKNEETRKRKLQEQFSERGFDQKQQQSQDLDKKYKVIKVVVVDRKFDLLSPAIHNFYYYPMMMDLLEKQNFEGLGIQNLTSIISLKGNKEILVQIEDPIFKKYKNLHIMQALTKINEDLKNFIQQNKAAQFSKTDKEAFDSKNLKEVIKSLPQYNKRIQSYKLHIDIMDQVINSSNEQNLSEIGDVQHLIVSKITTKDEELKDKKILSKVLPMLDLIKNPYTKLRLIFIIICGLETTQSERNNLLKQALIILKSPNINIPGSQIAALAEKMNEHLKTPVKLPQISKKYVFLDRHETKIGEIFRCILQKKPQQEIQKSISVKNLKLGNEFLMKELLTEKKFNIKTLQKIGLEKNNKNQFVLFMAGGISYNQMSNIERIFAGSQENRINYIVDAIYTPIGYLNAFSKLQKK